MRSTAASWRRREQRVLDACEHDGMLIEASARPTLVGAAGSR